MGILPMSHGLEAHATSLENFIVPTSQQKAVLGFQPKDLGQDGPATAALWPDL